MRLTILRFLLALLWWRRSLFVMKKMAASTLEVFSRTEDSNGNILQSAFLIYIFARHLNYASQNKSSKYINLCLRNVILLCSFVLFRTILLFLLLFRYY